MSKLDYDFSNADKDKAMSYGVIARTIVLDEMVERYLSKNPKTVVINIASGMDTRCYRMKGKYLRWYNVDVPETMEIREKFLTENGPIYQIAKSAMDASYTDEIVCDGENVLVVIEGLSMYLQEKDVLQKNQLRAAMQNLHGGSKMGNCCSGLCRHFLIKKK